jgi:hypothetical protein
VHLAHQAGAMQIPGGLSGDDHHALWGRHGLFPFVRPRGIGDMSGSHLKIWIFVRDQGETEMPSAGILLYVEDMREGSTLISGKKTFSRQLLFADPA